MAETVFEVNKLSKQFGGLKALDGVSFKLDGGETFGLVGPNGSGKTTLINVVCGLYKPSSGSVLLEGKEVSNLPAHKLAGAGVNRTFQIPRPFKALTVRENISLAISPAATRSVEEVLEFVDLTGLSNKYAGELNASQQKRLDLARAITMNPRVLFVDELGAGLNPRELSQVAAMLRHLSDSGVALVVVEHLMGFLEQLVDRVMVLNAGREIFAGGLREALDDKEVKRVFLGAEANN
jgi:branched-chain amino acid transport system ATP-binding protein